MGLVDFMLLPRTAALLSGTGEQRHTSVPLAYLWPAENHTVIFIDIYMSMARASLLVCPICGVNIRAVYWQE